MLSQLLIKKLPLLSCASVSNSQLNIFGRSFSSAPVVAPQNHQATQSKTVDLKKLLDLNALPTRPVRPNAFHLFFEQRFSELKQNQPNLDRSVALNQIKGEWEQADRAKYEAAQEQQLEKYRQELKAYKELMATKVTVSEVIELLNELRKIVRPRRSQVKRGYSSFNVYLREYAAECKRNGTVFRLADGSERFKTLSDHQKQLYQEKAEKINQERLA